MEDPQAKLEKMYLDEFLRARGLTWEQVQALPEAQRKQLITEATTYAAVKVAEIEKRAHLVQDLHGVSETES
jgi:hypothetical protein